MIEKDHFRSDRAYEVYLEMRERAARHAAEEFDERVYDDTVNDEPTPIEELIIIAIKGWQADDTECWAGFGAQKIYVHADEYPVAVFAQPDCHGVEIIAQAPVGKYHADFLIRVALAEGGYVFGALECDGHDHHNLTKAQAKHDRQRDRFFQEHGIIVLRYTGSEIWADPSEVFAGALRVLYARAKAPDATPWQMPHLAAAKLACVT